MSELYDKRRDWAVEQFLGHGWYDYVEMRQWSTDDPVSQCGGYQAQSEDGKVAVLRNRCQAPPTPHPTRPPPTPVD